MDKPHEEASEEKQLKEIQELLTLKENYLAKIADAEIMDNKLSEEVAKVRKDNTEQQEKNQMLQQRIADLKRAEKHARFHEYGLIKDLQGKKELLTQFAQLCQPKFDMEASVAKFETVSAELSKQLSEAPWLPEKRALMRQLNGRKEGLDNVLKEIAKMDEQIKEREQLLTAHEQLPFKKFCISLADYVQKSTNLKRMAKEEMRKAAKLAQQLKEQEEEEMALEEEEVNNDTAIEVVQPRLDADQITQKAPVEERNNPEAIKVHNAHSEVEQEDGTGTEETEQQEDQGEENVLDMEIDDQQEVQEENDDGEDDNDGDAVCVQILPKEDNSKNNQQHQYEETTVMSPLAAKKPHEREEDAFAIGVGGMDFLFGDTDGNDQHNASGILSTSFLGNDGAANDNQDGGGDFFSSLFGNDNADGQDNQNDSFNFAGSFNFQPDSSNTGGGDNNNDFGFPFNFN